MIATTHLPPKKRCKEVIDAAVAVLSTDINPVIVKRAIDTLLFHNYPGLQTLLITKLKDPIPLRQVLFATSLWRLFRYEPSAGLLIIYAEPGSECMTDVFLCFGDFKDNAAVRKFMLACITGDDEILFLKAKMTLGMWAYSGMAALRENDLLEALRPENKNNETFESAVKRLKYILDER